MSGDFRDFREPIETFAVQPGQTARHVPAQLPPPEATPVPWVGEKEFIRLGVEV